MQYVSATALPVLTYWACLASVVVKAAAPSLPTPCGELSPACLQRALQTALPGFTRGFPELGITPLDPFVVDELKLVLRGGLQIHFYKGVAKGFRNCQIGSANMTGGVLEVTARCNLTVKGKYKSSGRLLLFSIDGEGDSLIRAKELELRAQVALSTRSRGGRAYLQVDGFRSQQQYRGQVSYQMTNLIRGSPQLSRAVLAFMNANWRVVAEEFGDPIVEFGLAAIMENVKKLLDQVPVEDLLKSV